MSFDINNLRIGIVGLGYVGLPLAVEFGKKYSTVKKRYPKRVKPVGKRHDAPVKTKPVEKRKDTTLSAEPKTKPAGMTETPILTLESDPPTAPQTFKPAEIPFDEGNQDYAEYLRLVA